MTPQTGLSILLLVLFTGTVSNVYGWDVSASATDAVIGQKAAFKCTLSDVAISPQNNPNNLPYATNLNIESSDGKVYVSFNIGLNVSGVDTSSINSRYSFDQATYTLDIKDVECSDEITFVCILTVFSVGPGRQTKRSDDSFTVKVPPRVPNSMTTNPANLTGGVKEGDSVSATCNANSGRPKKGRIQWRVYRNNVEEILDGNSGGSGITISPSETSRLPTEAPCSVRSISTIRIDKVKVSDQNLVLTCFVLNSDFPANPLNCNSAAASLCQQSETIRIHYSVRDVQLAKVPNEDEIVEGRNVRLTCQASGFPEPKYTWSKVGDNKTLLADMDGSRSQLVLSNVNEADSGNYSCTATNIVDGVTYTNSSTHAITVVKPPPTTTQDPTESTVPGGPTGSPAKDDSSDDDSTTVIIIVVVIVVAVVIAVIVGICIYRKRGSKEDPPRPKEIPFYSNKQTLSGPPDVFGEDKKKPMSGSLNNSFDMKNEDGLMYADLTYDNRPRSRKPMAIGDTSSDYSDVQMPQV